MRQFPTAEEALKVGRRLRQLSQRRAATTAAQAAAITAAARLLTAAGAVVTFPAEEEARAVAEDRPATGNQKGRRPRTDGSIQTADRLARLMGFQSMSDYRRENGILGFDF